jgi:hypothetical protein
LPDSFLMPVRIPNEREADDSTADFFPDAIPKAARWLQYVSLSCHTSFVVHCWLTAVATVVHLPLRFRSTYCQ